MPDLEMTPAMKACESNESVTENCLDRAQAMIPFLCDITKLSCARKPKFQFPTLLHQLAIRTLETGLTSNVMYVTMDCNSRETSVNAQKAQVLIIFRCISCLRSHGILQPLWTCTDL